MRLFVPKLQYAISSWSSTLDIDYNMDPNLSYQPGKSVFPSPLDTYGPLDPSLTLSTRSVPDQTEENGRLIRTENPGSTIEPAPRPFSTVQRPALPQPETQYALQSQSRDVISRAPSENMHMAALALEDIAFGRTVNTHREIGSTGGHLNHGELRNELRHGDITRAKAWPIPNRSPGRSDGRAGPDPRGRFCERTRYVSQSNTFSTPRARFWITATTKTDTTGP